MALGKPWSRRARRRATFALAGLAVAAAALMWSCLTLERDPNERPVGAVLPSVELLRPDGSSTPLAALHPGGPKVLVFYRGAW